MQTYAKAVSQAACSWWSLLRGQAAALFLQMEDPRGSVHPALPSLSWYLLGHARASLHSLGTCTARPSATSVSLSPKQGDTLDALGAGVGLSRHRSLDILSDFLFLKQENNISLCLCRERSGWVCSTASGRASNVLCRVWKGWLPPHRQACRWWHWQLRQIWPMDLSLLVGFHPISRVFFHPASSLQDKDKCLSGCSLQLPSPSPRQLVPRMRPWVLAELPEPPQPLFSSVAASRGTQPETPQEAPACSHPSLSRSRLFLAAFCTVVLWR